MRLRALTWITACLVALPGAAAAAGLSFSETMRGRMTWGAAGALGEAVPVALHAELSTPDAEAFFVDPDHSMRLEGVLEVTPEPGYRVRLPVEEGRFLLLSPGATEDERLMVYTFAVRSETGRRHWFRGVKTLHDDEGADALRDTTVMEASLRRAGPDGPVVAEGALRFRWVDPGTTVPFLRSFRVSGAGFWKRLRIRTRFLKLYLATMKRLYL